ncbi:DNA topoisomerase (ATP-hydrolyzing) subunit A [Sediminispirochaeta smaragdinae]|uniref:DNA gyrase subunit A n=1 Tax=Sediminispirochaeta smaragdinae (strain DSM 11293 / JCM 15392 / SEBR 4228) TaxID=573413 RepID=E1RA59_SEDSS|nr:DNA topoisomerase (ATP-hydrolyzing) subunit A [Sediminispirochaeta smaragdinae]ADK83378.1 DNA gyrase, A subunit [Sediminispirochaeta smaragdinae DSM 11293]
MEEIKGQVIPISIEEEVRGSYLNYAMSVIVSRALPDVRDGLKPVHRRILYSMNEMGLRSDRAFKKCGRIVGDVLGKYHPHGDQSIYDALVRLAQDFSMRYPVVRPQGNFGSVDGDPPAAMRYTEAKMDRVAEEMLKDIKKETVDYGPNYDDSMQEPLVLPGAFPYLLTNGASGIAVGMATNMAPHNLREVCAAIVAYINDANISIDDLMKYIKGPDFPTGGIIFGRRGIKQAFRTGKGKITVRSKFVIETTKSGKDRIIVTEIPYAVNKANLIVKIADLVKEKRIDGISDLRDESDRDGMRIVIELKRGTVPKVVLNQLFSHTALQQNFNVTNLALVDGMPKQLNLKELVHYFVRHRVEVVTRRTRYDLKKAEERAHILEGLKIALDNIDEVVQIIKSSNDVNQARERLMERFKLSERQSQAILDMRLQKLTSLETKKIEEELREVLALIAYLKDLLSSEQKILGVVRDETEEIAQKYGDDRKTEIVADEVEEINIEDLIQKEDMVVLVSNKGFIKRVPVSSYRNQGRGGKGSSSAKLINEDFIKHLFIASTHDYILFVTNEGKAYWMKVHEIPEGSRASRGTHIKALLEISANEDITTIVSLQEFSEEHYLFMATARGIVKKVKTSDFRNARTRGIIAIKLDNGDTLITAVLTRGDSEIVIVSRNGNALRFHEDQVRAMGRASRGVTGIRLQSDDELAGILRVEDNEKMLLLSENGLGKRVEYDHFSLHGRGTRGQIAYKTSERSGEIVGVLSVLEEDDLVCITSQGNTIKLHVSDVPVQGKTAQGVNIVTITAPDVVVDVARVMNDKDEEEDQPQA